MPRIVVRASHRTFLSRIVFVVAGVALVVICAKGLALQLLGVTAPATITKVSFREDVSNDRDLYTTTAYVSYTFEADGAQRSGTATFSVSSDDQYAKTGAKYLTDYDLGLREEWEGRQGLQIRYLPMNPDVSDAAQNTENNVVGTLMRAAGGVLGLLLIFLAFKPNGRREMPAYQPQRYASQASSAASPEHSRSPSAQQVAPQQLAQVPMHVSPAQTAQASPTAQEAMPTPQAARANFCPNCGARAGGGAFCEECGHRLT